MGPIQAPAAPPGTPCVLEKQPGGGRRSTSSQGSRSFRTTLDVRMRAWPAIRPVLCERAPLILT